MKFTFKKEIYPLAALLKAAYKFTDRAYIHLDSEGENYTVAIKKKDGQNDITLEEYENEILAQVVRGIISEETKGVREILLARALSSTVIDEEENAGSSEPDNEASLNDILMDWFDKYDDSTYKL